ncbi:MAG: hypothetical protein ABIP95_00570 [Pelobium sp.]
METASPNKLTNSQLSVILILVNFVLVFILSQIGRSSNDPEGFFTYAYLIGASVILLGGFAFTYHGKQYRLAKWLFGISIVFGLLYLAFFLYLTALAGAYQH